MRKAASRLSRSALSLPRQVSELDQLVETHWTILENAPSKEVLTSFRAIGQLNAFKGVDDDALLAAVERRRVGDGEEEVEELKWPEWQVFTGRAGEVTSDSAIEARVRAMLEGRLDEWLARAEQALKTGSRLGYQEVKDSETVGLLDRPSPGGWDPFTVLNSLRDVEPSVGLVLQEGALYVSGDGGAP